MKLSQLKIRIQNSFYALSKLNINSIEIRNGTGRILLRIRLQETPAGNQFRLCQVSGSLEGSGMYFPINSIGEMELYHQVVKMLEDHQIPSRGFDVISSNWDEEKKMKYLREFQLLENGVNVEIESVA